MACDRLDDRLDAGRAVLVLDADVTPRLPRWSGDVTRSIPAILRSTWWRPTFTVAVDATPWSQTRSELAIRPLSSNCQRHAAAYAVAAHALADHLCAVLTEMLEADPATREPAEPGCLVVERDHITLVRLAGDLTHDTAAD